MKKKDDELGTKEYLTLVLLVAVVVISGVQTIQTDALAGESAIEIGGEGEGQVTTTSSPSAQPSPQPAMVGGC